MSTAKLLGSASVGTFMPSTLEGLVGAAASLELPLIDLQAQLTGALAASANISIQPPSIDLTAALAAAIQLPGISIDVTIMAKLAASLNLKIGDLELALALILALKAAFGTSGVYAWALEGKVTQMAPDLGLQLSGGIPGLGDPNAEGFGIVLLAQDAATIQALKTLFAVTGA